MSKITVYGAGYVGLVTAACLAELGHDVLCADIDAAKIAGCLSGDLPIYEQGLAPMVARCLASGRLGFSTDLSRACGFGAVQFVAVGTPSCADGSADLSAYWKLIDYIGSHLGHDCVVVNKSTVPIGTAAQSSARIAGHLARRNSMLRCDVVSNPEFLKQGTAVVDFMQADRVVLGVANAHARQVMEAVYMPLTQAGVPSFVVSVASAEFVKYAANAFLATKLSFINELSHLAEQVGADIHEIRDGMGFDKRIAPYFLDAGCGYGGSCFPKDVQALAHTARQHGCEARLLTAVHAVNQCQQRVLFDKVMRFFGGDVVGKKIALWGLAFKPGTDDLREAPSHVLMEALWVHGAIVIAYDPVAGTRAKQRYASQPNFVLHHDPYGVVESVDALCIMTEWDIFQTLDLDKVRGAMAQAVVFDGRNIFDPAVMSGIGFEYQGVGRGTVACAEYVEPLAQV